MSKIVDETLKELKSFKKFRYTIPLFILAIGLDFLALFKMPALSVFAGAITLASIGIILFDYADDKVNGAVNTFKEIVQNRNIAYAIYLLCYAIIISAGIIAAVLAFFSLSQPTG